MPADGVILAKNSRDRTQNGLDSAHFYFYFIQAK